MRCPDRVNLVERYDYPREEFAPRKVELPLITVEMPMARVYDALLPSEQTDELEVAA